MLNVNNNEKHTGTHTQRNANKVGKRDKGKRGKASKQVVLTNIVLYRRYNTM